jgi:hypothetical protein
MISLIVIIIIIASIALIAVMEGLYLPRRVFIKKNKEILLIVKCLMKTWTIPVEEAELKRIREVATTRLFGVSIPGVVTHGILHGPYGRVTAIARTKEGLFIRSRDGKLYFVGVPEAREIYSQYLQKRGEKIELP